MEHFWNTVSAVAFCQVILMIALLGWKEYVIWKREQKDRRRVEKRMREKGVFQNYQTPPLEEGAAGVGVEDEEAAYVTPIELEGLPLPHHPNIANVARQGACPVCSEPWTLPGPLPNSYYRPTYPAMPGGCCVLCGRKSQKASIEQSPSQN